MWNHARKTLYADNTHLAADADRSTIFACGASFRAASISGLQMPDPLVRTADRNIRFWGRR
jgi:hypothetical protein